MRLPAFAVLVFIAAVPFGYGAEPTAIKGLPADVTTFKERRDLCDHFRGEEPYDAERRTFLEESMNKYCTSTDRELASLKRKYRNNIVALKVLSELVLVTDSRPNPFHTSCLTFPEAGQDRLVNWDEL